MKITKIQSATFLFFFFLNRIIFNPCAFGQTYHYQNGISASGGFSYLSHFNSDFKPTKLPGQEERIDFSYELSYLNTKLLGEAVAFTYGISAQSLRHSFTTGPLQYTLKEDEKTNYDFIKTDQVIDQYHVGISFRWTFFLNQGRNRFLLGPGAILSIPVFHVATINGATSVADKISFKDRYFTEKGPYLFVPLEIAAGHQYEFPDCSLIRTEAFFQWKGLGLIQKSEDIQLAHYFGLRVSFFFIAD